MAPAFAYCCLLTGSYRCVSGFHFELGAAVLVHEAIKYQCVSNIEANVAVNITKTNEIQETSAMRQGGNSESAVAPGNQLASERVCAVC